MQKNAHITQSNKRNGTNGHETTERDNIVAAFLSLEPFPNPFDNPTQRKNEKLMTNHFNINRRMNFCVV